MYYKALFIRAMYIIRVEIQDKILFIILCRVMRETFKESEYANNI